MIVNNFDSIKKLLVFNHSKKPFIYQVQIIKRKNESSFNGIEGVIKTYCFDSLKHLEEKEEEIKKLCEYFKARAYISINPKSISSIWLNLLNIVKESLQNIINSCPPQSMYSLVDSTIASTKGAAIYWVIDCHNVNDLDNMTTLITNQRQYNPIVTILPTVCGYHIITKRFDKTLLTKYFGKEVLHMHSSTLLYCNLDI